MKNRGSPSAMSCVETVVVKRCQFGQRPASRETSSGFVHGMLDLVSTSIMTFVVPSAQLPNRGTLFVREGRLRPRHGKVRCLVTVSRPVRWSVDIGHLLQNFAIGLAVPRLILTVLRVKIVPAQQRKQGIRQL